MLPTLLFRNVPFKLGTQLTDQSLICRDECNIPLQSGQTFVWSEKCELQQKKQNLLTSLFNFGNFITTTGTYDALD